MEKTRNNKWPDPDRVNRAAIRRFAADTQRNRSTEMNPVASDSGERSTYMTDSFPGGGESVAVVNRPAKTFSDRFLALPTATPGSDFGQPAALTGQSREDRRKSIH